MTPASTEELIAAAKALLEMVDVMIKNAPHSIPSGHVLEPYADKLRAALASPPPGGPIPMILHCPACGLQHIDAPEWADERRQGPDDRVFRGTWDNPPHRSHLCHGCGHIWRPADVPTEGVAAIKTRGKADSEPVAPPPRGATEEEEDPDVEHGMARFHARLAELSPPDADWLRRKNESDPDDAECEARPAKWSALDVDEWARQQILRYTILSTPEALKAWIARQAEKSK